MTAPQPGDVLVTRSNSVFGALIRLGAAMRDQLTKKLPGVLCVSPPLRRGTYGNSGRSDAWHSGKGCHQQADDLPCMSHDPCSASAEGSLLVSLAQDVRAVRIDGCGIGDLDAGRPGSARLRVPRRPDAPSCSRKRRSRWLSSCQAIASNLAWCGPRVPRSVVLSVWPSAAGQGLPDHRTCATARNAGRTSAWPLAVCRNPRSRIRGSR